MSNAAKGENGQLLGMLLVLLHSDSFVIFYCLLLSRQ